MSPSTDSSRPGPDAAEGVDDKWDRAEKKAERVRRGFARLLGAGAEEIALGQNTHELVVRFLSALPLTKRPRLVTTDGEFHTIRRQLDRLAEDGRIEVVKVAAYPAATLAERLIAAIDDRTSAALVSSVLFETAHIVPGLDSALDACRARGAELLVDAYHHLNVVPFALAGLGDAFVVGGGYKYCQLGEGNCFLRVPPGRDDLRPLLTGWFSEFAHLTEKTPGARALRRGAGQVERRDVRPDEPLPGGVRVPLLRGDGARSRIPARGEPASGGASGRAVRRARPRSEADRARP
jgi:selenocysteine lyase/cysteine desulfurase